MKRYKSNKPNCIDINSHFSNESDENLIHKTRPMGDKQIKKIPNTILYNFVEDLLTDSKLSSLIYSGNAKEEIKYYKNSNRVSARSSMNTSRSSSNKKPQTSISRNQFQNQFHLIKDNISSYNSSKKERKASLTNKNDLFFKRLQRQKRNNQQEEYCNSVNSIRIKSLNRTVQRCKSYFSKKPNFKLPDVDLNLKNVYSRLYHNSIYVNKDNSAKDVPTNKLNNNCDNNKHKDSIKDMQEEVKVKKFNLKNEVDTTKGSKLLLKANNTIFNRCLFKHSGGPISMKERKTMKSIADNNESDNNQYITIKHLRDDKDNTYLHDAVLDNSVKFVKYYLSKKLSPNAQNVFGDTPFHYAMKVDNIEVIKLLLKANGNIYIRNSEKETPYDKASNIVKRYLKVEGKINERYLK